MKKKSYLIFGLFLLLILAFFVLSFDSNKDKDEDLYKSYKTFPRPSEFQRPGSEIEYLFEELACSTSTSPSDENLSQNRNDYQVLEKHTPSELNSEWNRLLTELNAIENELKIDVESFSYGDNQGNGWFVIQDSILYKSLSDKEKISFYEQFNDLIIGTIFIDNPLRYESFFFFCNQNDPEWVGYAGYFENQPQEIHFDWN